MPGIFTSLSAVANAHAHIRAEDSHIELEYGFFKIEWEMQEVEKTDGKLKRCSCVTRVVSHDAKEDLNSDPGDIDYESFDSNPQDEHSAPNDNGGAPCVVYFIVTGICTF